MNFVYETIDNGAVIRGRVTASSMDEAVRSLSRMGVYPSKMGEDGKEMRSLSQQPDAQQAPSPKKVLIASADDEEEEDELSEEPLPDQKPQLPLAWPSVPIPEPLKPPAQEFVDVRRRQTVLFGQWQSINHEIQRLLSMFGEVKFMEIQQDLRGGVLMAIVIEHDEPVKENKK